MPAACATVEIYSLNGITQATRLARNAGMIEGVS